MSDWQRDKEGESDQGLRRYVEVALQWWWLFLIVPLVAAPVLLFRSTPDETVLYEADTRVLIQSVSPFGIWDLLASQQLPAIYVELVTEQEVLEEVGEELGLRERPETIRSWVEAEVVQGTPILEILVTHTDPVMAAAVANKMAEVFVRQTQETRLGEVSRLQAMAGALGIADEGQILAQQLAALGSFTVVRTAEVPEEPVLLSGGSGVTVRLFMTLLSAALLAVALAFVLEYLAGKVRSPEKLEGVLGVEPLGVVPGWRTQRGGGKYEAVTLRRATTVYAEAYRQMVARLQPFWAEGEQRAKAPVVTSAAPLEGTTTTAVNLAVSAAESGRKVLLVDGDLWRPDIHRWFGLSNEVGLTNVLADPKVALESVMQLTDMENLRVITSGPRPGAQSQLLEKGVAEAVVARLKEEAEVVIIDSPPMLARSDAFRLASVGDGVIMVADANRTRTSALRRAMQYAEQALGETGNQVLGVVLNRFQPPRVAQYVYYRYYGGYYGYDGQYDAGTREPLPVRDRRKETTA